MRKLLSRCTSYEEDFPLFELLHDIALAKQITSTVAIAENKKVAPEETASGMQNFDSYWSREQAKLEDMVRQHGRMPNLLFTVDPAEWKFQWHRGIQHWRKVADDLSEGQARKP